jgi:hypothetical protein
MINPFKDVNWHPGLAEKRKFALSLIIGFPALALVFSLLTWLVKHSWKPFFLWLGVLGLAVGILLRLLPQIARPFYVAWYFLACCLGIVVSNVVIGLFFYLVFTPCGLLRRILRPDAFPKGFDRSRASYWRPAEREVDAKRYYRQF